MERQAKDGTVYRQVGQDEWEPITRKAKDGTVYKKIGADNWQPLEQPKEEGGFLSGALDAAIQVGRAIDSYTGAPVRSAVGAIQDGKNPLKAFISQVGENPDLAPTGKDIATRLGVPNAPVTDPGFNWKTGEYTPGRQGNTMQDSTGLALDMGLDWTNAVPLVGAGKAAAKGGVNAAKAALGGAARGAGVVGKVVLPEKAINIAKTGAQVTAGAAEAAKTALNSVFNPKRAEDYAHFVEIAQKNGIDPAILPESIEFGENSMISRQARQIREGVAGEEGMKRFREAHNEVQDAVEKRLERISGGKPPTEVEAGNIIRDGYDQAVDRMFNNVDFTYNSVISQIPGAQLAPQAAAKVESKLAGIEKFAVGRVKRGITNTDRAQGQQLLRAVQAVREGNGSMKQVYEAMQDIGRVAFKTQNSLADIAPDKAKLQDLYFTLRDAFVESTGAHLGDDIKNSLIKNNQEISDFLSSKSVVSSLIGNEKVAPEELFNKLVRSGDTKKLEALREILAPEQFNQLKGALLESLVKRNSDGSMSFRDLYNAMQNKRTRVVLQSMLEPQEAAEYAELIKLGDRMGPMVLSSSGTGGSMGFSNVAENLQSAVTNRATLDALKERARLLSAPGAETVRAQIPENIVAPSKYKSLRRTSPDNILKTLQVIGSPSVSGEQETAAQRRLKEVARKKLGQ